jgi:D-glycero-D-manno-heptose 1,7-bisphosphate phosphatase
MGECEGEAGSTKNLTGAIRGLFLDRDGVVNVDYGYVSSRERFHFIDGIFELTKEALQKDYIIIIVTNQAGIGRGYYTERDFLKLTKWMCQVFDSHGISISKVYYCPTHPSEGKGHFRVADFRRKPNPGMILEAQREFNVDLSRSILVGDKLSDMQAGMAAGLGVNILLQADEPSSTVAGIKYRRVTSLAAIKKFL